MCCISEELHCCKQSNYYQDRISETSQINTNTYNTLTLNDIDNALMMIRNKHIQIHTSVGEENVDLNGDLQWKDFFFGMCI